MLQKPLTERTPNCLLLPLLKYSCVITKVSCIKYIQRVIKKKCIMLKHYNDELHKNI